VSAKIHPVALVTDGARQASDDQAGLNQDRFDVSVSLKFDGGGQTSWSCANNDRFALTHALVIIYHEFKAMLRAAIPQNMLKSWNSAEELAAV
jgi:hypothetical protein